MVHFNFGKKLNPRIGIWHGIESISIKYNEYKYIFKIEVGKMVIIIKN